MPENDLVGVYDVRSRGFACGYSFRARLAAGVANVLGYTGTESRGTLLKKVISESRSVDHAAEILLSMLKGGRYSPGVYILAGPSSIVRIENFASRTEMRKSDKIELSSNHFELIKEGQTSRDSLLRRETAHRIISESRSMSWEGMVSLATHHQGKGSICRHGRTVASFMIQCPDDSSKYRLLFADGPPCEGHEILDVESLRNTKTPNQSQPGMKPTPAST